jgi:hypothetical protein
VVASSLALALIAAGAASAQKSGGILKVSHFDSPASMSPLDSPLTKSGFIDSV